MPLKPDGQPKQQADEDTTAPASTLEHNTQRSPEPGSPSIQPTPVSASYLGPLVHAGSWVRGLFRTEDTTYVNPNYSKDENTIEYSIYCIHGTADTSLAFEKIVSRLLENKPGESSNWLPKLVSKIHLLTFNGRLLGETIPAYAEQLKNKIHKNKDKHIILFGHSRGGLVAAEFTEDLAAEIGVTVQGVLTFGSPFGGSPLAALPFTLSRSVEEMKPGSEYLSELRALMTRKEERQKYFYFEAEVTLL